MANRCLAVLRLFLLAHLIMLALASAAETTMSSVDEDGERESTVALTIKYESSTMTSITVSWSDNSSKPASAPAADGNSTNGAPAGGGGGHTTAAPRVYVVKATNLNTKVRLISPPLTETEYTLENLAVDTKHRMCVESDGMLSSCAEFATIPAVRDDSLIALLLAMLVLAIVIIVAVILWRCAIRRAAAASDEETPSDEKPPEADDDEKQNEKSPLLESSPPASPADQPGTNAQPPTDPANSADQPQQGSLYLWMAGHAYK